MRIIQLSDLHLIEDPNQLLVSINTQATLEAVVEKIQKSSSPPDLILLTGDLSQDGSVDSYKRLAKTMETFYCPVYAIPGNHDDIDTMREHLKAKNLTQEGSILWDDWQIILLNSTAYGLDDGFLGKVDFAFLKKCLKAHPHHKTIIAFHHSPLVVHCPYMDRCRLINDQAFLSFIQQYPQIKIVLFGHVHQVYEETQMGIHFLSAPATSMQFLPGSERFAIDKSLAPGYRWLELTDNGSFTTGICRL